MSIPMSRPTLSLEGKTAVVTGGGTGIGRAIALALANHGADVVVASRRAEVLKPVADEISGLGRRSLVVPTDVASTSDVENLVQTTVDEFGDIDIFVNNAGLGAPSSLGEGLADEEAPGFLDVSYDHWDKVVDVNLSGVARCCFAAGKRMSEQKKGTIINISSVAAFDGDAHPYGVAKAGVVRLTKGLARELGPNNIRVNAIAPSWVRVEPGAVITKGEYEAMMDPKSGDGVPLGRIAEPSDIASVALFLASDASNYITGHTIVLDGGGSISS